MMRGRIVGLVIGPFVHVSRLIERSEGALAIRMRPDFVSLPEPRELFLARRVVHHRVDVERERSAIDVARARLADVAPWIRKALGPLAGEHPFRAATEPFSSLFAELFRFEPIDEDARILADAIRPFVHVDAE